VRDCCVGGVSVGCGVGGVGVATCVVGCGDVHADCVAVA